jgi:hypothetical protein
LRGVGGTRGLKVSTGWMMVLFRRVVAALLEESYLNSAALKMFAAVTLGRHDVGNG